MVPGRTSERVCRIGPLAVPNCMKPPSAVLIVTVLVLRVAAVRVAPTVKLD